jgi:hypothetical protein
MNVSAHFAPRSDAKRIDELGERIWTALYDER